MKPLYLFLFVFYLGVISAYSQPAHKCSHKLPFQKSELSDTLDAIQYTIFIEGLDFAEKTIDACTEVILASKIDNLDFVKLELKDLEIESVLVDGQFASFSYDGEIITISLANPINTGDEVTVEVDYSGEPFHEDWGGFHWSGEYCFNLGVGFVSIPHNLGKTWFPCIDDFRDRAYYKINATVEAGKDAVCGGLLEEVVDNGNGTFTYKWSLGQTIPTYLASIAVGDYARWTDTYNGINGDIPIEIWVRPSDSGNVNGSFQNLDAMLQLYEEKFGPYRFDRIGYVSTSIGFMEHATNIASPHGTFNGGLGYETYIAHELGHMWFGDNVTCASAEEMWINEGWATFMDGLVQENLYSREQYLEFMREKHKSVIQYCHTTSSGYFPLNQIPQTLTYDQLAAYDRGAIMVHTLRGYLGDDVFFDAMAAFNEEYKFSYVTSEDMRDFLTSHTGINMTGWFDNWVFHSGTPHYSIDSMLVNPTPGETDVTVFLKQKRHGPEFIGDGNKFEITFIDEDWNLHTEMVNFDGAVGNASFSLPIAPVTAFVDLNELMCDAITEHSIVISEPDEYVFPYTFSNLEVQDVGGDSALVRIEHNWAPPDALENPIQGLTISDYRYWKVDGMIPDGFTATIRFWYSVSGHLDDGILTNPEDSIIVMYRPSPAYDWQYVDFTKLGNWNIGYLYVDNMQKGEYTLAVCDDTFVGVSNNKDKKDSGMIIYPNPSNGSINIQTAQAGVLEVYNSSGIKLEKITIQSPSVQTLWETDHLAKGTYFVRFKTENNQTIGVEKLILH